MLTTIDNPHDPFTKFDEWRQWDEASGYFTLSFLARIVQNSHELSSADEELSTELAIDEIVRENVNGMYLKVTDVASDSSDQVRL